MAPADKWESVLVNILLEWKHLLWTTPCKIQNNRDQRYTWFETRRRKQASEGHTGSTFLLPIGALA